MATQISKKKKVRELIVTVSLLSRLRLTSMDLSI